MELRPFRIEHYYAEHEFTARYMLSSSDCESRTVGELLELEPGAEDALRELWCGYTESPGAPALREAIAAGYDGLEPDDVLVTSCAEEGIFLLYHALLRPGDHAIVETPCYESALELSRAAPGAEVSEWQRRHDDGWAYDLDELARLVRPGTRLIYVNTPHNPTGTQMTHQELAGVIELARGCGSGAVLRRGLPRPRARAEAAAARRLRGVRARGLAGQHLQEPRPARPADRLARLARRALLEPVLDLKHYTTICSSAPSELLSAIALRHRRTLRRPQPGDRSRQPAAARRLLRAPRRPVRVGAPVGRADRLPALARDVDVERCAHRWSPRPACCCCRERCTTSPQHVRVGFGRRNMPEALARLDEYLG